MGTESAGLWCRKNGTDQVYQFREDMRPRLGLDLVMVDYPSAMALRARSDSKNRKESKGQNDAHAQAAFEEANGVVAAVVVKPADPGKFVDQQEVDASGEVSAVADLDLKPQTPEEAMADINAASGDDDGVKMTDGLADMSRRELFVIITEEELPVKKVGKNPQIVENIRAARAAAPASE